MRYTPFRMERYQSTYEHRVRYNLSESGVHPLSVSELLEIADSDISVNDIRLGYGQSNGSDELRELIAGQALLVVIEQAKSARDGACRERMVPGDHDGSDAGGTTG